MIEVSAPTVAVYLTKKELQVLRRLIVEEATRMNLASFQRSAEWPSKAKRMRSAARKIWAARQAIDEVQPNGVR